MRCNKKGIDLIKKYEGLRLSVYLDSVGKPTCCYGHTGKDFVEGQTFTQEQAETIFKNDLITFEHQLCTLCDADNVILNENQFSALISFVFNVGIGALRTSTLWSKICKKRFNDAANEFERWIHAGNKKLAGLMARRQAEKKLFLELVEKKEDTDETKV